MIHGINSILPSFVILTAEPSVFTKSVCIKDYSKATDQCSLNPVPVTRSLLLERMFYRYIYVYPGLPIMRNGSDVDFKFEQNCLLTKVTLKVAWRQLSLFLSGVQRCSAVEQ